MVNSWIFIVYGKQLEMFSLWQTAGYIWFVVNSWIYMVCGKQLDIYGKNSLHLTSILNILSGKREPKH